MPEIRREFVEERHVAASAVAKNLMLARAASGMTQETLAQVSGVSRATIAQIESGESDPRLSTIVDLASALGVGPVLLLLNEREVAAIGELLDEHQAGRVTERLPVDEDRVRRLIESGVQKGQKRAAKLVANAVTSAGLVAGGTAVGAAIGSLLLPGLGAVIGAALGLGALATSSSFRGATDEAEHRRRLLEEELAFRRMRGIPQSDDDAPDEGRKSGR